MEMATNWNDLKHKSSPEVRATLKREAHDEFERTGFGKLCQACHQTQVAITERLKIPQGAVSRMEKRSDLLLSTLREYVGALGGKQCFQMLTSSWRLWRRRASAKKRPARLAAKSAAVGPLTSLATKGSGGL
jgi:hypothetical protein